MNSRKWVYLFISTLLIGGLGTIIIGFFVKWDEYILLISNFEWLELVSVAFWLLGLGFIFSLISQMGYFAYLTVHRFGLGLFRSLWNPVQLVLIVFVLFDLVYFRYQLFSEENESIIPFLIPAVLILVYSIVISLIKAKETNKGAFIPSLFFMVVVSTIEWVPALRANDPDWLVLMILPLIICNTWQLLILHRLTNVKK